MYVYIFITLLNIYYIFIIISYRHHCDVAAQIFPASRVESQSLSWSGTAPFWWSAVGLSSLWGHTITWDETRWFRMVLWIHKHIVLCKITHNYWIIHFSISPSPSTQYCARANSAVLRLNHISNCHSHKYILAQWEIARNRKWGIATTYQQALLLQNITLC